MELIGDSDDYRFHLWIGQHLLILGVGYLGFPDLRHPASQVVGGITDGIETGIPRSLAAPEMGGLGDHPTAKDTNSNRVGGLFHTLSNYRKFSLRHVPPPSIAMGKFPLIIRRRKQPWHWPRAGLELFFQSG